MTRTARPGREESTPGPAPASHTTTERTDVTTSPAEELARLQYLIDRCDPESLLDLLDARRERTIASLRKAVAELRADTEATAAAHDRLARALNATQPPARTSHQE